MIYANLAGYLFVAVGGFVLGTLFGHSFAADMLALLHSVEARIGAVEHAVANTSQVVNASLANRHATAIDHHAAAVEKLAVAIEKHAAAVDDHGAATVAAAIESRTSVIAPPAATLVAEKN